jgi:hypothetical protein
MVSFNEYVAGLPENGNNGWSNAKALFVSALKLKLDIAIESWNTFNEWMKKHNARSFTIVLGRALWSEYAKAQKRLKCQNQTI